MKVSEAMLLAVLLVILGSAAWLTAPTRPIEVPETITKHIDNSIPYCPTRPFGQAQSFYPCMYSDLEKRA